MEAILALAKLYWKPLAIGVVVLLVLGYIGILKVEISHYKGQVAELNVVINKYKADEATLKQAAADITKKHEAVLKDYNEEVAKNAKLTQDKIKLSRELKSTLVSLNAIKLFNESKRDPESTPAAVEGNVTGAGGSEASTASSAQDDTPTIPLAEIYKVTAENDANHLKCVKQVKEWQKFWTDYSAAVEAVRGD